MQKGSHALNKNSQKKTNVTFLHKVILIICGLLFSAFILEAGLRLGGFIFLSLQSHRNRIAINQKDVYRIVCLGESTSIDYPSFLQNELNHRNTGIKFSVINKAVPGINTSFILNNLEHYLDTYNPDMVITMMGINDWGRHMPYTTHHNISSAPAFFGSLRIYKLYRLLISHIITHLKGRFPFSETVELPQSADSYQLYGPAVPLMANQDQIYPQTDNTYIDQGIRYQEQGRFREAEALFLQAIERNPEAYWAFVDLAVLYRTQGRPEEAENLFKKAIELDPANENLYIELGHLCRNQSRLVEAESLFEKAIELNPVNSGAYIGLSHLFQEHEDLIRAEFILKQFIDINPDDYAVYAELGLICKHQGRIDEAEALFKKAVDLNPEDHRSYKAIEIIYAEKGESEALKEYSDKAKGLQSAYYSQMTVDNHIKLRDILYERSITYACMQYPMRDMITLKKIFRDNLQGIIFIDNETVFENALRHGEYNDYFVDSFGGDFGHCTHKGNQLMAENIANTILREVFGR
jgi:tetratricopeptide (TPR) repeat protein